MLAEKPPGRTPRPANRGLVFVFPICSLLALAVKSPLNLPTTRGGQPRTNARLGDPRQMFFRHRNRLIATA
ncbi:MAG TPA: hypothetical protein VF499_00910, partial [Afipia sp.]